MTQHLDKKISFYFTMSLILAAIIFLTPSNLFLKFFENSAYVNGLQIDYLIPKIYVSDIFVIFYIFLWLKKSQKEILKKLLKSENQTKKKFYALVIFIFFVVNLLVSNHKIATLWYHLKIIELTTFVFALWHTRKYISPKIITSAFLITLIFQILLGLYQFALQHSLFDYQLLGETNLNNFANISKGYYFNREKIHAYGTTAHPNILAGFFAIGGIFLFRSLRKESDGKIDLFKIFLPILILLGLAIYLTQSISAIATLLVGAGFIIFEQTSAFKNLSQKQVRFIFFSIVAIFITAPIFLNIIGSNTTNNLSIARRNYLNQSAWEIILKHPILGVGANNFTSHVEKNSNNREIVRFIQPAHHIGLLIWAEFGSLGLLFLLFFLIKNNKSKKFLLSTKSWNLVFWSGAFLPIAILDHYLITQQTGLLLLALLIGLTRD